MLKNVMSDSEILMGKNNAQEETRFTRERQLELIFKQAELALLASIICAAFLAYIVHDIAAFDDLVNWAKIMGAVGAIRYLLLYAFRNTVITSENINRWYIAFVSSLALSGAAWGSATFLLAPTVSGVDQAIVILFISGFVAGAAAAFAGDRLAFGAFAVPAVTLPILNLLNNGDPVAQKIAAVLAFFMLFLLASAERAYQARKGEFAAQLEREQLASALTEEKENYKSLASDLDGRVKRRTEQLSELNEKLQAEVFERGEAEQAARSQKARFTAAFENAPVGMIIAYHATGEIVKANGAVCELLGYKAQDLNKMRLVSLLCPSERKLGQSSDLFASNSTAERRFIHRRGHVIWGRTSIGAMSGDEFTDGYVVIQIQDVTELKSVHDKLSSRDGALGTAFESTPTPTAILDSCGRITTTNPRMDTVLRAAYGNPAEIALATLIESDENATVKLADLFSGRVSHIEANVTLFANQARTLDTVITVARVGQGNSESAFAVLHIDVSPSEVAAFEESNVVTLEPRGSVLSSA